MAQGLQVQIGAEITDFEKNIKKVGVFLNTTAQQGQQFGQKLSSSLTQVGNSLSKLPSSTNTATNSLMNLGRVVQDAPFGFIGIANNLNPLIESFGRLKQSTGSTGGAFKALASSLTGAGGLGFAVSVASSLLIVLGDKLFGAAVASKESENALNDYSDALGRAREGVDDLTGSLQFLNKLGGINAKVFDLPDTIDLNAQAVAQRQLTFDLNNQREALLSKGKQIIEDTRLNGEDRAKAIKENADEISEINKKIIDSERQTTVLYRQTALQRVEDAKKTTKEQKDAFEKLFSSTIKQAKELDEFFSRTVIPLRFDIDPTSSKTDLFKQAKDFIDKALSTTPVFSRKLELTLNPVVKLDINRGLLTDEVTKKAETTFADSRTEFQKHIAELAGRHFTVPITAEIKLNIQKEDEALERIKKAGEQLNNVISSSFQGAAEGFAENLGNALSGSQNTAQALIGTIADLISAVGKALVKFGTVKLGLDKILQNPLIPGGVAIGLGLAAIASAAILKNIKGFAAGGLVTGPQLALIGEGIGTSSTNPEVVAPLDKLRGMLGDLGGRSEVIILTNKLRGNDIALQQSRNGRRNKRTS